MTATHRARHLIAGFAGAVGGAVLFALAEGYPTVWLPVGMLVAAAVAVHLRALGAQLFARAVWWSNLGLGVILCVVAGGSGSERMGGLAFALACGVALLVVGRKALAEAIERQRFAPAAFRGALLLLMVLALADAQTFLLFTIVVIDKHGPAAWPFAVASAVFVAGFVGLYRVALWGALLNAGMALLMLAGLASHAVTVHADVDGFGIAVCVVQLVVAAPVLAAVALRRPLPDVGTRARAFAASGLIVLLMLLAVLGAARILGRP